MSLKALCHGVACPALTALWLSRDPLFVAPFCHGGLALLPRRRAFVTWHPLLSTTRYMSRKSRLGGPYLTIACVELIRGAESLQGKSMVHTQLEMRKDFARSYLQDGHIYIYAPTSSNMGLDAGSQVLNPKWQLAGSGPSLPGATQTFPLPVCRAFMAGSPGSLSAMHYFAPSFSGRSSAEIPRRTFMEARWNCTALVFSQNCSALLQSVPCTMLTHRKVVRSYKAKK